MGSFKWVIVGIGVVLFCLGTGFKIYNIREYEEAFTAGNSYIGIVVGIISIALAFTFDYLAKEDAKDEEDRKE